MSFLKIVFDFKPPEIPTQKLSPERYAQIILREITKSVPNSLTRFYRTGNFPILTPDKRDKCVKEIIFCRKNTENNF